LTLDQVVRYAYGGILVVGERPIGVVEVAA